MMIFKEDVALTVNKQIENFWSPIEDLACYQKETFERLEYCFSACKNKYFRNGQAIVFSTLNSVQYSIYLYYLANTIYKQKGNVESCSKLYYLNKIFHSVDWYYEISLPEIFCVEHPLGSVMGRAQYSNKFFFYQGCTVGGSNAKYPIIGENVVMYSNSSIIGDCIIGNNVIIGANTVIKNIIIPDNSLVFGQSPNLCIKIMSEAEILKKTAHFWS